MPYVAVADPDYVHGKVDALDRANTLMEGYTGSWVILMLLFSALDAVGTALEASFRHRHGETMFRTYFIAALTAVVSIYTYGVCFYIYRLRDAAVPKG